MEVIISLLSPLDSGAGVLLVDQQIGIEAI